ncbi:MAG: hypothetical protein J6B54_04245 [Clostridia bacterium]|nr:hypothetical protein [Clostridia bacterium]
MQRDLQTPFPDEKPTVFGRSRMGNDLEEYRWGDQEKSILFLSGFTSADRPISQLLIQWKNHLKQAEKYGEAFGDFDLKSLKNKCRIRIIPVLNPDAYVLNQNGLKEKGIFPSKTAKNPSIDSVIETNYRGVNLNQNFNANWLKMRMEHPEKKDIGPFPESEAETASLTALLRKDLPRASVILRWQNPALRYPRQALPREVREAVFLGQYSALPVSPADDNDGTAFQWLSDRGVRVLEIGLNETSPKHYARWRDLLTMCAALT